MRRPMLDSNRIPGSRPLRAVTLALAILCAAGRLSAAEPAPADPTPAPTPLPAIRPEPSPPATGPAATPAPDQPAAEPEPTPPPPTPAPGRLPPPAIRPFARQNDTATTPQRTGAVTLSNGKIVRGRLHLTPDKPIRLLDLTTKKYRDITFESLTRIDVSIEFEKKQEEWSFKEGGNDEKIYSGNFYFDRRYQVQFTFADGASVKGYVLGTVFYLTDDQHKQQRFFLHKDERGENKQEPKDLIYVQSVVFDPPAKPPADPPQTQSEAPAKTPSPPPPSAQP